MKRRKVRGFILPCVNSLGVVISSIQLVCMFMILG